MRVAETQLPERWLGGGQRDSHATVSHARCEGPSARAFTPKLTPGESESCGAERTRLSPRCSRPEKNGALFFTLYKRYVQRPITDSRARCDNPRPFFNRNHVARSDVLRCACARRSGENLHRDMMASHLFALNARAIPPSRRIHTAALCCAAPGNHSTARRVNTGAGIHAIE